MRRRRRGAAENGGDRSKQEQDILLQVSKTKEGEEGEEGAGAAERALDPEVVRSIQGVLGLCGHDPGCLQLHIPAH